MLESQLSNGKEPRDGAIAARDGEAGIRGSARIVRKGSSIARKRNAVSRAAIESGSAVRTGAGSKARVVTVRRGSATTGARERNGNHGIANFDRVEREGRLVGVNGAGVNGTRVDRRDSSAAPDHLARVVGRTRMSKARPAPAGRRGLAIGAKGSARSAESRDSSGRDLTADHDLRAAEKAVLAADRASRLHRAAGGQISKGVSGPTSNEVSGQISKGVSGPTGRAARVQNRASMANAARDSKKAQSPAQSLEASASFAARAVRGASLAVRGPARSAADGSADRRSFCLAPVDAARRRLTITS